jgi:hypothetical protein
MGMTLLQAVEGIFDDMRDYLRHLDDEAYAQPLEILSGSSVGQHTRHIIEFFTCLLEQRCEGCINYDGRRRDPAIEQLTDAANKTLLQVSADLNAVDPKERLSLAVAYDGGSHPTEVVDTTFEREVIYNIEHAIHHLAMIKIGLRQIAPELQVSEAFGVAPSTIRYRKQEAKAG